MPLFYFKIINYRYYSIVIASDGHSDVQAAQSMQVSLSTRAFPSTSEIAPTGQTSTQAPQPVHFEEFTNAGILISFFIL
jgi:hypothetical protein